MNAPTREAWTERTLRLLDHSTDILDAATLSRLNRARQAALSQPCYSRIDGISSGLLSACALALAIGIVAQTAKLNVPTTFKNDLPTENDLDLLATSNSMEFYED